jgi:predicted nucleic acid-binding Zn ribbon protein
MSISEYSLGKLLGREYAKGTTHLYFDSILRQLNLPSEQVELMLLDYFQSGAVEGTLELRCPECGKDLGRFKKLREIPAETTCYICGAIVPQSFSYVELVVHLKSGTFFRGDKHSSASNIRTCIR